MTIQLHEMAKTKKILATHQPPRGATHFRFADGKHKPVIDKIANIDSIAGCKGELEWGKVEYEGRGKHAKIKAFTPMETPSETKPAAKAQNPPTPAQKTPPVAVSTTARSKERKNKILGHSACAVAKALGKAGVRPEEADRIMRSHGIEMPKASLSVQLGFGRNPASWERHGQPAALTDGQIAELRATRVEQ